MQGKGTILLFYHGFIIGRLAVQYIGFRTRDVGSSACALSIELLSLQGFKDTATLQDRIIKN